MKKLQFKQVIFVGLVLILGYFFVSRSGFGKDIVEEKNDVDLVENSDGSDLRARYAIYTNGEFRVFTKSMYHNLSDEVYIQSTNPNVVYVQVVGITWGDFFRTLPFSLARECLITGTGETYCSDGEVKLEFYINGAKDDNALEREIVQGDGLLVTFGIKSDSELKNQLNKVFMIDQ